MYRVIIAPKAQTQLKLISYIHKLAINQVIGDMSDDPFIGKPLTRELTGRWSVRVSVYRIIYIVDQKDETVTIISAGHRRIIYK